MRQRALWCEKQTIVDLHIDQNVIRPNCTSHELARLKMTRVIAGSHTHGLNGLAGAASRGQQRI